MFKNMWCLCYRFTFMFLSYLCSCSCLCACSFSGSYSSPCTGWDDQSWTKLIFCDVQAPCQLKFIFGLKSNGRCVLGCLTNNLFSFNLIFLSNSLTEVAEWETCFADTYYPSRSYSVAMDGCMATKFEWGLAWTSACKALEMEKSSEFKSSKYGCQSAKIGIPPTAAGWF
jgi:hypothetical protein